MKRMTMKNRSVKKGLRKEKIKLVNYFLYAYLTLLAQRGD
jgi:hypothetical protein